MIAPQQRPALATIARFVQRHELAIETDAAKTAHHGHLDQMNAITADGIPVLIHPTPAVAANPDRAGPAAPMTSCVRSWPRSTAMRSTAHANHSSSRSSATPSTTDASTASIAEADPPAAPNGD